MDWHVVTSSKGGSGKTLVALMLSGSVLTAFPNRPPNDNTRDIVLVIDFNANNTNLRRILACRNYAILRQTKIGGFIFQSVNDSPYVICWKTEACNEIKQEEFFQLIFNIYCSMKKKIEEWLHGIFGGTFRIQTVIIDTNPHFSNLFSLDKKTKRLDFGGLSDYFVDRNDRVADRMFIWFIWDFNQLFIIHNYLEDVRVGRGELRANDNVDAELVYKMGQEIDRIFNDGIQFQFVHVFSPILVEGEVGLLGALIGRQCPLRRLADLDSNHVNCTWVGFVQSLENALKRTGGKRDNELPLQHIERFLNSYIEVITEQKRPKNVIPLLFEVIFRGYTNRENNDDFLQKIQPYAAYGIFADSFRSLCNRLPLN